MRNIITRGISILLMIAVLGLIINRVINTHAHIAENGVIITHAHPCSEQSSEDPLNSHQHTAVDFSFLDHIDLLFAAALVLFYTLLQQNRKNYYSLIPLWIKSTASDHNSGRAPPFHNYK